MSTTRAHWFSTNPDKAWAEKFFLTFALTEALAIFALLVSFYLVFAEAFRQQSKGMARKMSNNYMGLTPTLMTASPAVAEEAHGSGGLPQFDPTWWPSQLLWLALTFAVLYFVFSRSTLPRLGGILETRALRIESRMSAWLLRTKARYFFSKSATRLSGTESSAPDEPA